MDSFSGARLFSTINLWSGYWQVELDPAANEKTVFIARDGLFQFTVMPFGLSGAPATFQRLMELILAGLKRTFEEHLKRLGEVLQRFRQSGLKISPSKCRFLHMEVTLLGHSLSAAGIKPEPKLTNRIPGQQRIYESASRGFRLCFAQPASDISATVPRAKQCGRLGSRDSIASHHFELVLRNSKWHKDFIQVRLANWKRT